VALRDGTTAEREVVLHRGAVALVPMVDDRHVCLVRNRRYAIDRTLLEVPAGTIDPGESPDQTAGRELLEETGYQAGRIRRIREWYVSPGVMNERMSLYLCEDLRPGPTNHQPDEELQSVIVPWEEAMSMAEDGRIEDAKTLLALMICDRLRRRSLSGG
jgi:ADP-ribose pyrophosphatase